MSDLLTRPGAGLLLAIGAAMGLSVCVAGVGLLVLDRVSLRTKLREIDDLYRLVDVRDQELMLPLKERVSGPVQRVFSKLGHRVSPSGYVDGIRLMMLRAGRLDPGAADRFLAVRSLTLLAAPVVALIAFTVTASLGTVKFLAAGLGVTACVVLPSSRLNRRVEERERLVR